jgi:hypothetical protein
VSDTPSDDELGIFIDSEGSYRVLIPESWSGTKMPEFAYLVVAAVLRLARRDEIEFAKSLARWAKETLKLPANQVVAKKPRSN